MDDSFDRRKATGIRELIIPLVTAIIVGVGASFVASKVAVAVLTKEVEGIKKDIGLLERLVNTVSMNQLELAARGEWMINTNSRLARVEKTIENVYSKSEMDKQHQQLEREIKLRHGEKP